MRLAILDEQRFSCHSCTNCCRNWHVELVDREPADVAALAWPEGDPLRGAKTLLSFRGRTYLAHRPNGACIFLNEANGRCRIHEQFGLHAKPLGCRLFPFHVAATFPGQASVLGRHDCPSIRANKGQPLPEQRHDLEHLAGQLALGQGFDAAVLDTLTQAQIETAVEFLLYLLNAFPDDASKALFLYYFTDWLASQNPATLSRETLGQAFPQIQNYVQTLVAKPPGRVGWAHRLAFRAILAQHLRRDEDVLDARARRLPRAMGIARVVLGGGHLRSMGQAHPPGRVRAARLFAATPNLEPGSLDLLWRLVREKLAAYQFMGRPIGRDFLQGLRSLALLHPLVVATARLHATGRASATVQACDTDFAVGAIDHAFGRIAVLRSPLARHLESILLDPRAYPHLVRRV